MKKTALTLMLLEVLLKILGFAKYIFLGRYYGTSFLSDAYLISLTIPIVLFDFIGSSISTTFIPLYSSMLSNSSKKESDNYVNNLINMLFLGATLLILLAISVSPWLVRVFASGFHGETFELTVKLTRISMLGIYFTLLMSVLRGFLYIHKCYTIPQIVGIPYNLIIIIAVIISSNTDIVVLSLGTLLAMFIETAAMAYFSCKKGFRYRLTIECRDQNLKKMLHLSTSTVIGTSVKDINKLIDRTIASRIIVGGISALNYAARLNEFVQHIFVSSIVTVLYPAIAKMAAQGDLESLKKSLSEAIRSICFLVVPAAIGAMVLSEPIIQLLFGRGAFNQQSVELTSEALLFYSVGMIPYGIREVLAIAFYSLQDTKTPMVNGVIAMLSNIILNIILSRYMGIGGLALSTSISAFLCAGLLLMELRKKIGSLGFRELCRFFLKILLAALLMGAVAKFVYMTQYTILGSTLSLLLSIGIGAISYIVLICLLKVEEAHIVIGYIKDKVTRRPQVNK